MVMTHIIIDFHAVEKPWREFIDTPKLVVTSRSISLECCCYDE
jgi:hypothetical protein